MNSVKGTLTFFSNPRAQVSVPYTDEMKNIFSIEAASTAVNEISHWPNYRETPLYSLENLAHEIQVEKIWYKDESQRFHLKSFKSLGGAYAVMRQLKLHIKNSTGNEPDTQELLDKKFDKLVSEVVISCATDGNHGRSVAWGCQLFGCQCVIYIHRDVSEGRKLAIENLDAEVIRIMGNYDESVKRADSEAKAKGRIIVSDTSYEAYMEIPKDVALGYGVLLAESIKQMVGEIPTHVFIQGGVGGLASAVCAYFWEYWGEQRPRFIIVEPENANCLQASAKNGKRTVIEGRLETCMAGLACGEVSSLAWDILESGCNDFVTVNEEVVPATMQLLGSGFNGDAKIEAGESAVAGLAALIIARNDLSFSEKLGLDEASRIYVLGTEGATDPELYDQLMRIKL